MSKYKFKLVQIMLGHFHFQEEKSENINNFTSDLVKWKKIMVSTKSCKKDSFQDTCSQHRISSIDQYQNNDWIMSPYTVYNWQGLGTGDWGAGGLGQGFKFLIIINITNLRPLFKLYLRSKPPCYTVITLLRNPTRKINKLNYLVGFF